MDFVAVVDQVIALLRQRGRITYRTLQLQFMLDDAQLAALKDELLYSQPHVVDDAGRGLIWVDDTGVPPILAPSPPSSASSTLPPTQTTQGARLAAGRAAPEAERRQLTVLFCDLVDSTALSSRLDPEDLREVVHAYQTTCAAVIQRFEGHIAQYLGDGLLVYFGYPQAHEDDAQRAVCTGLGIVEAMEPLNHRMQQRQSIRLAVRVGIHTGLVVVGETGGGGRQEQLALGETPNIAARLQGLAAPDTVVISAVTQRLIQGYFTCHDLGLQTLKGVATPMQLHQVVQANEVQQRFDVVAARGLTPLVGRAHEVGLLRERWAQVQDGRGHIVLLSGEAGIGKSRLVQVVKDEIIDAATLRIEYRCAPYHQHSGLGTARVQRTRGARGERCLHPGLRVVSTDG
jgi:class 3 adenylate cyclase